MIVCYHRPQTPQKCYLSSQATICTWPLRLQCPAHPSCRSPEPT
jgi:hypothetical protein